jgi:hypothetical protein
MTNRRKPTALDALRRDWQRASDEEQRAGQRLAATEIIGANGALLQKILKFLSHSESLARPDPPTSLASRPYPGPRL